MAIDEQQRLVGFGHIAPGLRSTGVVRYFRSAFGQDVGTTLTKLPSMTLVCKTSDREVLDELGSDEDDDEIEDDQVLEDAQEMPG